MKINYTSNCSGTVLSLRLFVILWPFIISSSLSMANVVVCLCENQMRLSKNKKNLKALNFRKDNWISTFECCFICFGFCHALIHKAFMQKHVLIEHRIHRKWCHMNAAAHLLVSLQRPCCMATIKCHCQEDLWNVISSRGGWAGQMKALHPLSILPSTIKHFSPLYCIWPTACVKILKLNLLGFLFGSEKLV